MFGPSRKEIWRQLSAEIGGQYVDGGFWRGDKVQATHDGWTVTLDTYTVHTGKATIVFTRMRAPFENPHDFRFTIYRKGLFSDIATWFGMQDLQVGYEPFDQAFIVKGTDEGMVRALFANPEIRDLVAKQKDIHLTVKDNELHFHVPRIIRDVDRLKLLYELFAATLDQLQTLGVTRNRQ